MWVFSSFDAITGRRTAACTFELFAADRAYELATTANLPFRDACRIVSAEVAALLDRHQPLPVESQEQLVQRLNARSHQGSAGNLGLAQADSRLEEVEVTWKKRAETFTAAIQQLVATGNSQTIQEG